MNADMLKGLGAGLALGTALGIALEIAYERWQDRKYAAELAMGEEAACSSYRGGDESNGEGAETATYRIEPNGTVTYVGDGSISAPGIAEINPVADHDGDDPGMPYVDYAGLYKPETMGSEDAPNALEISEEEFDDDSYDKVFCTYAQDDDGRWELTNDDGNVLMDVNATVGADILSTLVESERDRAFVRNVEKGVDYLVEKFEYVE